MGDVVRRERALSMTGWGRPAPVERWLRRGAIVILCGSVLAGLANVFGQRPRSTSVSVDDVALVVTAPVAVRSGLVFQGRFEITAERSLREPTLVLAHGWFDAITLNTVEPAPKRETSVERGIALVYEPLPAGRTLTAYLEFQANPTAVGRRDQAVEVRDGGRVLAHADRSLTIYP